MAKGTDNPGPGNYNYEEKHYGPSFKMGGRAKEKYNDNPGPGTYTNEESKLVNSHGRSYRIGTA